MKDNFTNVLFIVITLLTTPLLYAQSPSLDGSWAVLPELTDEFDGEELDSNKWRNKDLGWTGRHPSYFEPNNISLENGELHLKSQVISSQNDLPKGIRNKGYTHSVSAMKSRVKIKYGYFEVRAKPADANYWNSFWFYDHTPDDWTEIAPFEIVGSENYLLRTAHLYRTPSYRGTVDNHIKAQEEIFYPADYNVTEYHIYGLDWNKDNITWYVDGVEVFSVVNEHWHQDIYMIFDTEVSPKWPSIPDSSTSPATFKIDYIRSWKRKSNPTKSWEENDEIISVVTPETLTKGQTVTIPVSYKASADKKITCVLKSKKHDWDIYAKATADVSAGKGTVDLTMTIPEDISTDSIHQLQTWIGNDDNLDDKSNKPVKVL